VARPLAVALTGFLFAALLGACGGGDEPSEPLPEPARSISLDSPAFSEGGTIPRRYTCDGEDVSPPLRWSGVPARAREQVLLVEDRDADRYVHWTVLAIPPETTEIAEGRPPRGSVETENGFGKREWGGPCPPEGDDPHRYVFALYATDVPLGLGADASPDDVRSALADHALARGTLTGLAGRG
jgi:Raf kinase inhibitor-like YbhB/YbcL family protein